MQEKKVFLRVKDYSVSSESFELLYNETLDMLETHPQPTEDKLSDYYKSEDYISHTDSKRNVFEKVYHTIRNISLKRKLNLINNLSTEDKNLLDIGCGTGDFLKTAQDSNWTITGIEPNIEARRIANSKTNNSIQNIDALLSLEEKSFDVITLWHVLEHLPNLENHISIFKKLLKPNGFLIIAVPNYKSFDAKKYKQFWAAYDVPRHLWHFSQTSIERLFETVNMSVEKSLPMKFDSYYVSLLSEKYRSGWMNIFSAFVTGLRSNLKARGSKEYSSLIYVIKNN